MRLHNLLAIGCILVCSNPQLGCGSAARQLAQDLDDSNRWQPLSSMERGRTAVRLKLCAQSGRLAQSTLREIPGHFGRVAA